ncbi:uncharacterized protein [Diadema antillarum]|uniref:uncharacterized protein isoform X1 n=1 Tax=Diadema antillarum TaxID=105358 RepID=UPI003A857388
MAMNWFGGSGFSESAKPGGLAGTMLSWRDVYLRPFERGFFCSDLTIKYPYHETDTIPVEVLVLILIIPSIGFTVAAEVFSCRRLRVANRMYMYGALSTVFVATILRLAFGRLSPNAVDACKLNGANDWQDKLKCSPLSRKLEVSQSFPCLYSTLSSYASTFIMMLSLQLMESSKPSPSIVRPLVTTALTLVLVIISITRYHDYKSHSEDIIAGLLVGAGSAYIWAHELFTSSKRGSSSTQPQGTARGNDSQELQHLSADDLKVDILLLLATNFACWLSYNTRDVHPIIFYASVSVEVGILMLNFFVSVMRRPKRKKPRKSLRVAVCSSAARSNVDGFVAELGSRFVDVVKNVQFIQLPYSKLDDFDIEGAIETQEIDVLTLCHSIENRRLSLTDVTDALYANFIPRVSAVLGKTKFLVVAHDFKWDVHEATKYSENKGTLKIKQPTVFDHAEIILAGKLDGKSSVEVSAACWEEVSHFLKDAAQQS